MITLVIIVIALLPLLTKGTVYNHITGYDQPRSDFRDYTAEIQTWIDGEPIVNEAYYSRVILGYPIMLLSKYTGIEVDRIYITVCFLSLILAGFTLFWMMRTLIDKQSAWMSIILSIMCSTGVLAMFYFGMISNIINMYVILPVCIVFSIKWYETRKKRYALISIFAMALFSLFHTTALYIPYTVAVIIVMLSILVVMKKKVGIDKIALLMLILFITNLVITYTLLPSASALNEMAFDNAKSITTGGETQQLYHSAMPIGQFIIEYLTIPVIGILAVITVVFVKARKNIEIGKTTKYLLVILGGFAITLLAGAFLGISPEPVRTSADLATIMAIIVAVLAGVAFKNNKSVYLRALCYLLMAVGITNNLTYWIR